MSDYENDFVDDYMDFEEEPEVMVVGREEVEKVVEWLPRAPASFDAKFVWSLKEQIDRGRNLSPKQLSSINNIIEKFRVGLPAQRRKPPVKSTAPYHKTTDAMAHYY